MGIPLLGDPIYKDGGGDKTKSDSTVAPTTTSRTMLHASGIHIPEFLGQEEINIWCPPTFFRDGDDGDDANNMILSDSLDLAVEKLMAKNCDVDGILTAMQRKCQNQE